MTQQHAAALPTELDLLVDRLAIEDLMWSYLQACDEGDEDAIADCFVDDAVFDYGNGSVLEGRDQMRALARNSRGTVFHTTMDVTVVVDGDEAVRHARFVAYRLGASDAAVRFVASVVGWSSDRLVRTPSGWRIKHRALRRWPQALVGDDVGKPDGAS